MNNTDAEVKSNLAKHVQNGKDQMHPETYQVQEERSAQRRVTIHSFKKRANDRRTAVEKVADWMTNHFGTVLFLNLNMLVFAIWIAWNTSIIPGVVAFDPFPFGLLTMAMSIEAIILAIIVLISQNREAKVTELREEMNLQIDMIAEEETTKVLKMLAILLEKHGVDLSGDRELQSMLQPLRNVRIEQRLEQQLN